VNNLLRERTLRNLETKLTPKEARTATTELLWALETYQTWESLRQTGSREYTLRRARAAIERAQHEIAEAQAKAEARRH
jgi:geranylgeranyl pyrophosphate synthase